ncbi:hypothetical protein IJ674_03970 [bacterium]|nr:hypothetical protein [bacterium]
MKVDIVNQNYQSRALTPNLKAGSTKRTPHFTGMSSKQIEKEMMNMLHHKKAIEFMKSFEWLKGEIGGILLTALGTGLVAPIFIGYNPFVHAPKDATPEEKEDVKNTKQYTAMRQPVSAALAILFQAGVQKYIDKGLDAVFNNPKYSKKARLNLDQQVINTDSYIKNKIKKEMAEEGLSKPSLVKSWFSSDAKEKRASYSKDFDSRVERVKNDQLKIVADGLEKDNVIHIGERNLENKTTAKLINKQIDSYIDDAKALKKNRDQIVFYKDRAQTLIENEDHLREIFKDIPVEKVRKTMDEKELSKLYEQVGKQVQELLEKETNPKVRVVLSEIMDKPADLRAHRIERTLQRIDSIKKICSSYKDGFTVENYGDALHERNKILDKRITQLMEAQIREPHLADENVIKKTFKKLQAACTFEKGDKILEPLLENTDTFASSANGKKLKEKIYKDIAKAYKKLVDNNYKSWNQITKIGVGVFITLPITCTALNWVYPRFMEIFFPKLAGVKKDNAPQQVQQQGGDK